MKKQYIAILFLCLCFHSYGEVPNIQFSKINTENSNLSHNYVMRIVKDSLGFVWIGTTNGLNRYDGHNIEVFYQGDRNLASSRITNMCIDSKNVLWVNSGNVTQYYDYKKKVFITESSEIFSIITDKAQHQIDYIVNDLRLTGKDIKLKATRLSESPDGRIWLGTNDGIYVFDKADKSISHINSAKETPFSLSDNRVTAIYAGMKDEIWVGTRSGVFYSDPVSKQFIKTTSAAGYNLKNSYVNSFVRDDKGQIWISTENSGILIYNLVTGGFRRFFHHALPQHCLNMKLFGNDLWLISENGVVRINIETGKSKYFGISSNGKRLGYSRDICRNSCGDIFVGTHIGLFELDHKSDRFIYINNLSDIYVESLFVDSGDRIWISTASDGAICYNPADTSYVSYRFSSKDKSLPSDRILSAYEDKEGDMWFCTFGKGICRLKKSDGTFEIYNSTTLSDSSFHDICHFVLNDNDGNLWIGTGKGIVCFNPETRHTSRFTTDDGLLNNVAVINARLHLSNDDILFGTADGFTTFNASELLGVLKNTRIIINSLEIDGNDIDFADCINLNHDDNNFRLNISITGGKHSYSDIKYRMKGYEDMWQTIEQGNIISYSNLPSGKYALEIKEANTGMIKSIPVHVPAPLFLRWWAFLIYAMIISGLVFSVILFLRKRDRKKNIKILEDIQHRQEKELLAEKMTFLSNIVHEIKTPLTLIKSPLNAIARELTDNAEIKKNIEIISNTTSQLTQLTNELLEYMRLERKGYILENKNIDLNDFVRNMSFNFTEKARAENIIFEIMTGEEPMMVEADMSSLKKIFNNLLGNAFKYCSQSVMVLVRTSADCNCGEIVFSNDGEPIPDAWKEKIFKPFMRTDGVKLNEVDGIGLGLPLARSLARLNSGEITLSTSPDRTEFILSLPLAMDIARENIENRNEKRYNLLIVDDNLELRGYLAEQLGKEYNIHLAGDGSSAIKIMHKHNIDLLITDISMPQMNGIELCKNVRNDFDISHILIIVISGKNDLDLKIACIENGANIYIEKPLDVEYLRVCTRNLLDQRSLMQNTLRNSISSEKEDSLMLNRYDREFVEKMEKNVMGNLSNPSFSVQQLEEALNMSSATLLRKFKRLLNTTPNNYIKTKRLILAAQMLASGESRISEVCFACGFNSTSYFTKCFHDYYGCSPQSYIQNHIK